MHMRPASSAGAAVGQGRLLLPMLLCAAAAVAEAKSDDRKPPMGWMSWEYYGCERDCVAYPDRCISARLYR
eukprot:SAG22_NODE_14590_length_370_cov_1.512915_1_plen_70_part_10